MSKSINVTVNYSWESPRRPGWVRVDVKNPYYNDEPTVVISQSLERTEQWETDSVSKVYIPLNVLKEVLDSLP